jgi:hypothetical protein
MPITPALPVRFSSSHDLTLDRVVALIGWNDRPLELYRHVEWHLSDLSFFSFLCLAPDRLSFLS